MRKFFILLIGLLFWANIAYAVLPQSITEVQNLKVVDDTSFIINSDGSDSAKFVFLTSTNRWVFETNSDSAYFQGSYLQIGDTAAGWKGWIRYSSSKLQYSNDSGSTWNDIGTGAGGGADADSIKSLAVQDTTGNIADNYILKFDAVTDSLKWEADVSQAEDSSWQEIDVDTLKADVIKPKDSTQVRLGGTGLTTISDSILIPKGWLGVVSVGDSSLISKYYADLADTTITDADSIKTLAVQDTTGNIADDYILKYDAATDSLKWEADISAAEDSSWARIDLDTLKVNIIRVRDSAQIRLGENDFILVDDSILIPKGWLGVVSVDDSALISKYYSDKHLDSALADIRDTVGVLDDNWNTAYGWGDADAAKVDTAGDGTNVVAIGDFIIQEGSDMIVDLKTGDTINFAVEDKFLRNDGNDITTGAVDADSLHGDHIVADNQVDADSVDANHLVTGSAVITTINIAANAVDDSSLNKTYLEAQYVDDSVANYIDSTTLDTIQNAHKAVLADSAVTVSDLAVTTGKIQNLAVSGAKLGGDAVDDTKIGDDAVKVEHIHQNLATTGQVLKWSGTVWAASNDLTGGGISEDEVGITELDDENAPVDEDILTYEHSTTNLYWHTPAELGLSQVGHNHDATITDSLNRYLDTASVKDSLDVLRNEMSDTSLAHLQASVTGNTETGIAVTYQTADSTLDFEVDTGFVGAIAVDSTGWDVPGATDTTAHTGDVTITESMTADSVQADHIVVTVQVDADSLHGNHIVADNQVSADSVYADHVVAGAQLDVTGDITVSGTVDTVDLANLAKEVEDLTDDSAAWNNAATAFDTNYVVLVAESLNVNDLEVDTITADSVNAAHVIIGDQLDIGGANITFVSSSASIDSVINSATAGDVLHLAAGTYTITDDIDVTKSISIIGQGRGITKIVTTTDNKNAFHVTASNVVIQNLSIDITASQTIGILADGTGGTVLNDIMIDNVDVILNSHAGYQQGIRFLDAGGEIRNAIVIVVSSDAYAYSIVHTHEGTAEAMTTLKCYGIQVSANAGGDNSIGFFSYDNSATNDNLLCVYNSIANATGATDYGISASGGDAYLYADNCVFGGDNYNAHESSAGGVRLRHCVLVNGTTSGTITYSGTTVTDDIVVSGTVDGVDLSVLNANLDTANWIEAHGWGDWSTTVGKITDDTTKWTAAHTLVAADSQATRKARDSVDAWDNNILLRTANLSGTIDTITTCTIAVADKAVLADTADVAKDVDMSDVVIEQGLRVIGPIGIHNYANRIDLSVATVTQAAIHIDSIPWRIPFRDETCSEEDFAEWKDSSIAQHPSVIYVPNGWPHLTDSVMSYIDTLRAEDKTDWIGYLGDTIYYDTTSCTPCDSVKREWARYFDDSDCDGTCDDSVNLWVDPHKYWFGMTPFGDGASGAGSEVPNIFAGNSPEDWGYKIGPRDMDTIANPIYVMSEFVLDSIWFLKIMEVDSHTGTKDSFYTFFDTGWSSYDAYKAGQVDTIPDTGYADDTKNSEWFTIPGRGLEAQIGDTIFIKIEGAADTIHHNESPGGYTSDPDIFFDYEGNLWLIERPIYQPNLRGLGIAASREDIKATAFVAKSESGLNWSSNLTKILHLHSGNRSYLSPSALLGNSGEYWMWTTWNGGERNDSMFVRYITTKIDTLWTFDTVCVFTNTANSDDSTYVWHFDVVQRGWDELLLVAHMQTNGASAEGIEIAYSHDDGVTWTWKGDYIIDEGVGTWDANTYRPTAIMIDDGASGRLGLWYGGMDAGVSVHRTGYTEVEFKEGYEAADDTVRSEIRDSTDAKKNRYVPLYSIHGNNATPGDSVILNLEGRDANAIEGWLFRDSTLDADQTDTILMCGLIPWGIDQADSLVLRYKTSSATEATSCIANLRLSVDGVSQWTFENDTANTSIERLQLSTSADPDFNAGGHICLQIIFEGDADAWLKVYSAFLVCDE